VTKRRWYSIRLPRTYLGFPVPPDADGAPPAHRADYDKGGTQGSKRGQRGIALIIAIMIISIMMLFTSDLILSSQVNMTLATNQRDNVKAEYMAKSGFNAALLLTSADLAYDLQTAETDQKAQLTDGLGDIWSAMNGLPIGGETLEMLNTFQQSFELNTVLDSGVIDQLKLFDGQFSLDVSDETQKINVNFCSQNARCAETMLMLEALFSCPAEKAFLDSKKLNGRELAYRIKDYVDTDSKADENSGYNDEDEPYRKREPPIRAKNAPFDTIDELKLIEGWDEEVQAVFSPYLTVFPFQQKSGDRSFININTANRALLQCLFPESKGDCQEKTALALRNRNEDKTALGGAGKSMPDILRDTLCYSGGAGNPGEANNRANWFAQNSMTYRVEVRGTVGDSEKVLTAVIERTVPDVKKNEKASYKVLYWKML
jgi:general secretion pathway protein K